MPGVVGAQVEGDGDRLARLVLLRGQRDVDETISLSRGDSAGPSFATADLLRTAGFTVTALVTDPRIKAVGFETLLVTVDGSVGAWGYARGGMGAVTKALADSFVASGGNRFRVEGVVAWLVAVAALYFAAGKLGLHSRHIGSGNGPTDHGEDVRAVGG